MEENKTSKGGKRGADGLTKQQRYVKRHKPAVNAANAERNRAKRAALKLEHNIDSASKEDEVEQDAIAIPELTTQAEVHSPSALPEAPAPLSKSSVEDHPREREERRVGSEMAEIYNSVWFDQQLDRSLAALDALDASIAASDSAVELVEESKRLEGEINALVQVIYKRWNYQVGWHFKREFEGSNLADRISSYVSRAQDLLRELKDVLRLLPADEGTWEETLDRICWAAAAQKSLGEFYCGLILGNEEENDEDDQ